MKVTASGIIPMAGNEGPAARYSGDGTGWEEPRFPGKPERHFNAPVRLRIEICLIAKAHNLPFSIELRRKKIGANDFVNFR